MTAPESHPLKGKRIAIIGGAGFIGHHMALLYASHGAEVSIIDGLQVNNLLYFSTANSPSMNRELYLSFINQRLSLLNEHQIPIYIQDVRDYYHTNRILAQIEPHYIIHLAAVAHADRSNKDPYSTFDHSLRTLENTLDYARNLIGQGLERYIYFSSSMVYGHFSSGTVNEETHCEPLGIYGALKYAGEKMVIAYNQVFNLPYTIIRPSALYGERCVSRRVGQIFVENALMGKDITIKGSGEDSVDFTYVDDLIMGIELAMVHKASLNETFNLTFGQGRSIAELAEIVKHHLPEANVVYLPKDHLMPDRGTLSIDKARDLIGYDPQFPLEKGMAKYIDWYRAEADLKPA